MVGTEVVQVNFQGMSGSLPLAPALIMMVGMVRITQLRRLPSRRRQLDQRR